MTKAKSPIPEGFSTVTVHITVDGAAKYIDFLKQAFGAVELGRAPGPGGKLLHAMVQIGSSYVMLNDTFPEMGAPAITPGNWPITIHLYVPDADAWFKKATDAGCQVQMPLADQFWGDRYGTLKDPFGFNWAIGTRIEELSPEEMKARQDKLFGAAGA